MRKYCASGLKEINDKIGEWNFGEVTSPVIPDRANRKFLLVALDAVAGAGAWVNGSCRVSYLKGLKPFFNNKPEG